MRRQLNAARDSRKPDWRCRSQPPGLSNRYCRNSDAWLSFEAQRPRAGDHPLPIVLIPRFILSLISWSILAIGAYLLWRWDLGYNVTDGAGAVRHLRGPAWALYAGGAMLTWSFLGRFIVLLLMPVGEDEPREARGEPRQTIAPDGAALRVEYFGRAGAPTLILTHGWGLSSTAWWYTKQALGDRFRLITWDLPGLGRSSSAKDGKVTIDRFAQALGAIVDSVEGPVILVGHSIGGMTTQTVWRACGAATKARVAGIALIDTTYENPLHTMLLSPVWRALRWPLIEPMMWLTIPLMPLAWLSSWQGYLSGSNHIALRLTGFGKAATRGQVDLTARLACKGSPAVQAKGNLAMFRWMAREVPPTIGVPMLILTGSKDIVTLPAASREIAALAPAARIVEIEGAGHMGFMEYADAYNGELATFAAETFAALTREHWREDQST
jgi:pimeloyl-ACP methyl ester carboxylesterase